MWVMEDVRSSLLLVSRRLSVCVCLCVHALPEILGEILGKSRGYSVQGTVLYCGGLL